MACHVASPDELVCSNSLLSDRNVTEISLLLVLPETMLAGGWLRTATTCRSGLTADGVV